MLDRAVDPARPAVPAFASGALYFAAPLVAGLVEGAGADAIQPTESSVVAGAKA